MNGKFKEAREYFEQAAARDPKFLNGATIFKAAYAQWLAGDLPGADNTMRRFLDEKKNAGDRALAWREATWLFTTGRTAEAMNRLSDPPVDQKDFFNRQRMIWRGEVKIPEDLTELQKLYDTSAPAMDGLPRVIYAKALLKAGKPDQAQELLKRFPLPDSAGDPLLQSLIFPQLLALRRELKMQ